MSEAPVGNCRKSTEIDLINVFPWISLGRAARPALTGLLVLAALSAGLWQAGGAIAQTEEESPRQVIVNSVSGDYEIVVGVTGVRSVVGPQRFTITVRDVATREWVTDARVSIFGTPPDGGRRLYSPALNSPANPTTYISQIPLNDEGAWVMDVEVTVAGVLVATEGVLEVEPRVRGSGASVPYGTAVLGLILVAFFGGAGWLVLQSRKAMKARRLAEAGDGTAPGDEPRST